MAHSPTLEAPSAAAAAEDVFVFGGRPFRSRLIVGTGKYATFPLMKEALEESGAEIVTVAVRRVNLTDRSKESLLDYVPKSMTLLPNTAGCYTRRTRFAPRAWAARSASRTGSSSRSSATSRRSGPTTRRCSRRRRPS